jgi:diadenosine tetraphosphatase ApaH/serine/threonine PP2A family protein phosphatase
VNLKIINNRIFCVHGGVPRQLMRAKERILNEIEHIPKGYIDIARNELVNDLLWADPSIHNEEKLITPSDRFPEGFAPNSMRGGEACVFGTAAVQFFNRVTGCTHIIRAHQPPDLGISLGKNAKVITVFSSSHYCGQFNSAAVVLIADYRIHVIVTTHNQKLVDSPRASRRMEDVRQQQLQAEYQMEEDQAREEEEEHQQQQQQLLLQQQQQQQQYQLRAPPASTFSAPIASSASQSATQPFLKPSPLAALPRLGEPSPHVGKQPIAAIIPPAYGKQGPVSPTTHAAFVNGAQPTGAAPASKPAGAPTHTFNPSLASRGKVRSFSRQLGFQRSLSSSSRFFFV